MFGSLIAASLPLVIGVARRPRHVPVAVRDRLAHRRVGLRPQPHDRPRASAWRSTTACSSSPATGRSCAAAPAVDDAVVRTVRPPAAPSRSARSPSPCRCRPCSCSRCPSCARSPTPASRSCCWRWSASIVVLPALLAVARPPDRRAARLRRDREPKPESSDGFWHRIGHTASCAARCRSRSAWSPCSCSSASPFLRHRSFGLPDDRVLPDDRRRPRRSSTIRDRLRVQRGRRHRRRGHRHRRRPSTRAVDDVRRARCRRSPASPGSTPPPASFIDGALDGRRRRPTPPASRPTTRRRLAVGGADGRAMASTRRRALVDDVRGRRRRRRRRRRWAGRRPSSSTPRRRSSTACRWALGHHRRRHVRAAVPDVRQRARADQGARAQPAQPHRHVRGHGVDLPGRPPRRLARLHRHRAARHDDADPDVLHRLRAVDGLRGVPALPHQGGARPHRRQRRTSVAVGLERTGRIVTAAAAAHRRSSFLAFATSGVSFIKLFGIGLALAVLMDAFVIRAHARAGVHAAGRRGQLVGAGSAAPLPRALRRSGGFRGDSARGSAGRPTPKRSRIDPTRRAARGGPHHPPRWMISAAPPARPPGGRADRRGAVARAASRGRSPRAARGAAGTAEGPPQLAPPRGRRRRTAPRARRPRRPSSIVITDIDVSTVQYGAGHASVPEPRPRSSGPPCRARSSARRRRRGSASGMAITGASSRRCQRNAPRRIGGSVMSQKRAVSAPSSTTGASPGSCRRSAPATPGRRAARADRGERVGRRTPGSSAGGGRRRRTRPSVGYERAPSLTRSSAIVQP